MTDERRQELEAWVGRVLSPSEELYEGFLVMSKVVGQVQVLVAHAWLLVQDAHLDVKIPPAQILKRWGVEMEDMTLSNFAMSIIDLEGPRSLMMISAFDAPRNGVPQPRRSYTTADNLHTWVGELLPFGYTADDLLTDAEAQALLPVEGA